MRVVRSAHWAASTNCMASWHLCTEFSQAPAHSLSLSETRVSPSLRQNLAYSPHPEALGVSTGEATTHGLGQEALLQKDPRGLLDPEEDKASCSAVVCSPRNTKL